jgi:hypothetical protein
MEQVRIIKRANWFRQRLREMDDGTGYYIENVGNGSNLIFEDVCATDILKEGLRAFLDRNIDGDGDESGFSEIHIEYILLGDGTILYDSMHDKGKEYVAEIESYLKTKDFAPNDEEDEDECNMCGSYECECIDDDDEEDSRDDVETLKTIENSMGN